MCGAPQYFEHSRPKSAAHRDAVAVSNTRRGFDSFAVSVDFPPFAELLRLFPGWGESNVVKPLINTKRFRVGAFHGSSVPGSTRVKGVEERWSLVTGASAGLGRALAHELARRGYSVVLVSRRRDALEVVAREIASRWGTATEVLVADLHDSADRERVGDRLVDSLRPIEVLVNNAGYGIRGDLHQTEWSAESAHTDIHVTIPLQLVHRVLPGMLERGTGHIVFVASVAAFLAGGTYSSAKAWAVMMARSISARYRSEGVTATALCPGFTRTEFHERMGFNTAPIPRFAWLASERVARTGIHDALRRKSVSVPSALYRMIVAVAGVIPDRFHRTGV